MNIYHLINKLMTLSCCLMLSISTLTFAKESSYPQFNGDTPDAKINMDFELVDAMLSANVINMGPSRRVNARRTDKAAIGTRLTAHINVATHNEGNRFSYELIKHNKHEDKVAAIKQYLESLPTQTPLNLYTKQEQLAYWLNLYTVTLINEIVKKYPYIRLEKSLTSSDSLLDKKLINIGDITLSLNDIQHDILFTKYNKDPLIMYGLHQGMIGSPRINKTAYLGKNVYELLKENAAEFINSNRGVKTDSGNTLEVSSYYANNEDYFPDFNNNLKTHLLQYANTETSEAINQADTIEPNINNWNIADLFGSKREFGQGLNNNAAAAMGAMSNSYTDKVIASSKKGGAFQLSPAQMQRLTELSRVRARNLGSTSVTVTDLESKE